MHRTLIEETFFVLRKKTLLQGTDSRCALIFAVTATWKDHLGDVVEEGFVQMLSKPYTLEQLRGMLQRSRNLSRDWDDPPSNNRCWRAEARRQIVEDNPHNRAPDHHRYHYRACESLHGLSQTILSFPWSWLITISPTDCFRFLEQAWPALQLLYIMLQKLPRES